MPWKKVNAMQQRLFFINDYLRAVGTVTELSEHYGISRKTAYKWIHRYHAEGEAGLKEHSRRPQHHPEKIPYRIEQAIITLRQQFTTRPGAKKLQVLLAQHYPNEPVPSKTSIYNILHRAHLVDSPKRKRRVAPYPQPFAPVNDVNELWSVDYKGQFKLRNSQWCYPLTIMDHQSRYLCDCTALAGPRFKATKAAFIKVFKRYGLPKRIRSDNGVPFASPTCGGLSQLSIWWIKLGIVPERIEPGKPQQNGRHERMHRTLKQAATRPPSSSLAAQQKRFNAFCKEYNTQRPHEALNQKTPSMVYECSTRVYPKKLLQMHYPDYYDVRKVSHNGCVYWRNKLVYVSHLLKGEWVGLDEIADGLWEIYFGPMALGKFNVRQLKGKTTSYLSIKV